MVDTTITDLQNDIDDIKQELGLTPQGVYADVRVRLDILETRIGNTDQPTNVENPFFIGSDGVSISTGIGVPIENRLNGSIFLRKDGNATDGVYTRQGNSWFPVGSAGAATFQAVAGGTIAKGQALRTTTSGNVIVATTNLRSLPFDCVSKAGAASSSIFDIQIAGPLDPGVANLGAGVACAVGVDASGHLVRAIDPTCVSAPNWVGTCDILGNITVAPRRADNLNVVDFGADSTGTNLCDAAFTAVKNYATNGDTIFIPQGTYRYANTWGPFTEGIIIRGVGIGQAFSLGYPFQGSILQYEGLADAVRQYTRYPGQNALYTTIRDLVIRGVNPLNRAPTRLLPHAVVGNGIASVVSNGGLCKIGTNIAHGLLTGQMVLVKNIVGTTEANNAWVITVNDATHFTITGSLNPVVPVPTFTHAYISGGTVSYVCGAGLADVQGGLFLWENLYIDGFATGMVLDGSEDCVVRNCVCSGPGGNGLAGDVKRFSAAAWLTESDWGCRGATAGTNSNVIKFYDCNWSGNRIGVWAQGGAGTYFAGCLKNLQNVDPIVLGSPYNGNYTITAIDSIINDGTGKCKIHTVTPHHIDTGVQYGSDPLFAGVRLVVGTTEANGEFIVTIQDANTFTLVNTVGGDGTISAAPSFSHTYVSGGQVHAWGTVAFAQIAGAVNSTFEGCYSEGDGDAHYLFTSPEGDASATRAITIRNHIGTGGGVGTNTHTPYIWVDTPSSPFGYNGSFAVYDLILQANFWAAGALYGAAGISGVFVRTGNYWTGGSGGLPMDGDTAATTGLAIDRSGSADVNNFCAGTTGIPSAHWHIKVNDFATPLLRINDAQVAKYLDFWVNSTHSTDFERSIQSTGAGDKSGTNDSLRSATLLSAASATVIGTSAIIPPSSNGYFEVTISAHRDDDDATKGATWIFCGTIGQSTVGSLAIISGPTTKYSYNGDPSGFLTDPVVTASGSTLIVTVAGHTSQPSTWTCRFEVTKSQRAR